MRLGNRDLIYAILKECGKLEYRKIVEMTGIPHKTCSAVIRWMSKDRIIKRSFKWNGSQTITSWEIFAELKDKHAGIPQEQVVQIRAIIESHGVIERGKIDDLSGLEKLRVTALLQYMRANGLAHKKQFREYSKGDSAGRAYYAWSLEPFEQSPKWKPRKEGMITEQDKKWQQYWRLPREIRKLLPKPETDGL